MPALFFPNPDALRLTLASGLVPTAVTAAPVRAGRDEAARLWLELDELPARDTLTALARFGVAAQGSPGTATAAIRCWAELLPLRPAAPAPGPTLFELPDRLVARFAARLRRLGGGPLGVRLLPDPHAGRAWVACNAPPLTVLLWTDEPDSPVRAFRPQAPGVWVPRGWEHPLAAHLTVPAARVLLCEPDRPPVAYPAPVPDPGDDEWHLPPRPAPAGGAAPLPRVEVPLRLSAGDAGGGAEALWVLDPPEQAAFREFCRGADESVVRRFLVAVVERAGAARWLVRHAGEGGGPVPPLVAPGFRTDPRFPTLFVPSGCRLRPHLRASELARVLALSADALTWLEPIGEGRFVTGTAPLGAFRPLADLVEYAAPAPAPLAAEAVPADPFPMARFALAVEPDQEPPVELTEADDAPPRPAPAAEPTWVLKSVERLFRWVRRHGADGSPADPRARPGAGAKPPAGARSARVEQKLSSADALLHGHDRAARRHELEGKLLSDFPRLGAGERAARWAELAAVYGATGQALDAAVCWVNAIWECAAPPLEWLDRWAEAECHAAKRGDRAADLDRWLAEPGRPGTGRVVAALAARAGFQPAPPPDFVRALPQVLAVLDQHFDDVPVRGAWLARLAAARACNGDALGLARWRDRVVQRLHDRGPGLDLDEPSFLRFRGSASFERFKAAGEWLVRARDPVLAWVQRHGGGARLEWAGLEAETEATSVYAQLMLAWGLGALGERAKARDWAARSRKALVRVGGPRVEPAAHALLGDLFLHRIKDAHEGAVPKPGLPADLQERLDKLPEFARYAVDRLREHCRILEPHGTPSAYHGRELKEFWTADRLGERLSVLVGRPEAAHLGDEARALLALANRQPSTATVPRVAFALLEVAPYLDPALVPAVLELVPSALDWMEAWVRAGRWTEVERPGRVARLHARVIGAALAVAPSADAARALLRHLTAGAAAGPLFGAAVAAAPRAFRAARKFQLSAEAEALMGVLDPQRAEWGREPPTADRVGLAAGWFAAGDEEAGNRALNAAREHLFLAQPGDRAARTALALAYAEALGFAPAGIALGRLEELFQRLDGVAPGGSTNRYFTLQPLRLIDTVVRSVLTDEFTLSAAVRAWLGEDEYFVRGRIHRDMAAVLRGGGS